VPLSETQKRWASFVTRAQQLRNQFHHHGMCPELVSPPVLDEFLALWKDIKGANQPLPELGGGGGALLISPLGLTPGVLFSALHHAKPDSVLILCSQETRPLAGHALGAATFAGPVHYYQVRDPHAGYDEEAAAVQAARDTLLAADRVCANLTGGTTCMSILVQKLAEAASRLDRPLRRFALIDRRPPEQQRAAPFVTSEVHWLDD
jgi:hypothetical protein